MAAVIKRDGRYLICKRPPDKRHGGLWEFPGGKLEPGESYLEAARRELKEELKLENVRLGDLLLRDRDDASGFEICFTEVEASGEPELLEHTAIAWKTAKELLDLPLAPSDRIFALHLNNTKPPDSPQLDLAMARTLMALDRTLLAWIRTSISLIGFGFTLAKYIHGFITTRNMHGINTESPKMVGLAMIFLGIGAIVGGMIDYFHTYCQLKSTARPPLWSPAMILALAIAFIGLYLIFDIFNYRAL